MSAFDHSLTSSLSVEMFYGNGSHALAFLNFTLRKGNESDKVPLFVSQELCLLTSYLVSFNSIRQNLSSFLLEVFYIQSVPKRDRSLLSRLKPLPHLYGSLPLKAFSCHVLIFSLINGIFFVGVLQVIF